MDGQPSTPDSDHTVRVDKITQQPIRKARLYELATRRPVMPGPSGLNPMASPFKLDSPTGDSKSQVFYKEDDFRPSATAHSQDNDSDDSLPRTFLPPDSPDTSSTGGIDLSEDLKGPHSMVSTDEYKGVIVAPGQHGNLTTYGVLARSTQPSIASGGNCGSSSGDDLGDLLFTPSSTRGKSNPTSIAPTPSRKWSDLEHDATSQITQSDTHNTSGGVRLYDIASQTKTFPQLTQEQGFRIWNCNAFDDRWMLRPVEMWKIEDGRKSAFMNSANSKSSKQSLLTSTNLSRNQSFSTYRDVASHPSEYLNQKKNLQQNVEHLEQHAAANYAQTENSEGVTQNKNWRDGTNTVTSNVEEEKALAALPPEVERLRLLMHDINSSRNLIRLPYSPRIIRRYFYDRCFGNGDGPSPLGDDEKNTITRYNNQEITLERLRDKVLQIIEDLILSLMAPICKGSVPQKAFGAPPSPSLSEHKLTERNNTTGPLLTCSSHNNERCSTVREISDNAGRHEHEVKGPLNTDPSSNPQHDKMMAELQQMFGQSSLASGETAHFAGQEIRKNASHHDLNSIFGATTSGQHGNHQLGPKSLGTVTHSQPPSAFGRFKLGHIDEEPSHHKYKDTTNSSIDMSPDAEHFHNSTVQNKSPFDGSSSINAAQSTLQSPSTDAWSSRYSSISATPYQSLETIQHGGYPGQQFHLARQTGPMTPAQLRYLNHQQMQSGMTNDMPFRYGQQQFSGFRGPQAMTPGGQYGPNGIWIPNDRYVRPPATSRLAPLYARTTMWPAVQQLQPDSIAQHPKWQNRFGTPVPAVLRDNRKLPYLERSKEMYPRDETASVRFQNLTRSQPPSFNVVTSEANVPFVETARATRPAEWGVMKIGNIPYDLTKGSIIRFLGNHAKIITPELGPSVHIIMDRATGKTQDCYIEFFSTPDARAWVNLINSRGNNCNRLSERLLDVRLSSQDELLKELFPRAKNVSWEGGRPNIIQSDDPYNSGFKTFISAEELQTLVRHAEQPHRSIYTHKCPGRPYEAMISLLSKFPWQATQHYTLATRNKIFDAALKLLHVLSVDLTRPPASRIAITETSPIDQCGSPGAYGTCSGYNTSSRDFVGNQVLPHPGAIQELNIGLLKDLMSAALNAPGFSERQRWELYNTGDLIKGHFLVSPLAQSWPFEVLGRKRGIEEDVVEWYARLMGSHPLIVPSPTGSPFGDIAELFREVNDTITVEDAGEIEWNVMRKILLDQCSESSRE